MSEKWQIKSPARVELLGPSETGKSTIVLRLIEDDSVWDSPFTHVVYCAPFFDVGGPYARALRNACGSRKRLRLLDSIPDVDDLLAWAGTRHPILLVLDDLLAFGNKDGVKERLNNLMTLHSHHHRISVVLCLQNPFVRARHLDLITLGRNCTALFVLYQVSDYNLLRNLNTRIFPERKNFLVKCLETARDKYGCPYVFVNLHPFGDVERRYICYTNIFADERRRFSNSPVFFDLTV